MYFYYNLFSSYFLLFCINRFINPLKHYTTVGRKTNTQLKIILIIGYITYLFKVYLIHLKSEIPTLFYYFPDKYFQFPIFRFRKVHLPPLKSCTI